MGDEEQACCPICSQVWEPGEFALNKELHVNSCLERIELVCPICGDAQFHSPSDLERHANACLDAPPVVTNTCPVCLVALRTFPTAHKRIQHVKQCTKEFHIQGPRDLQENPGFLDMLIEQSELVGDKEEEETKSEAKLTNYFEVKRPKLSSLSTFQSQKPWQTCPSHKKIPNSGGVVVDAFQYASPMLSSLYVLTHFHYDHYIGLCKKFDCGTIYCSATTGRLLCLQLQIPSHRIAILPIGKRVGLGSECFVTAFDANHCPGAMVLVFESHNGQVYCHTGDFRATEELARGIKNLSLRLMRPVEVLFLDTTYCRPEFAKLASQNEVFATLRDKMQRLFFDKPNRSQILVVIGTYTIGKERLALECVGQEGGKLAVTAQKLKILRACDGFPSAMLGQRFTTQRSQSQFWLVGMQQLEHGKLTQLLKGHERRFSEILAIRGTGWVHTFREVPGTKVTTLFVPYSEHSSLGELQRFVRTVNPKQVAPTVPAKGTSKQDMLRLLTYAG
ncbi:hypothetical protein BASA81_006842 [Batrachochytrium salamandrivorans]|nr:hypothetical protein BASA81_006842 [Batrachochytrium salamandrivorans]